jgi:hypothetical protein
MSEGTEEKPAGATEESATEEQAKSETDWKAEARKWEQRAKENSSAAEKLAQIEESKKSELEKVTERIAATERERDQAKAEALRFRIANEYKLSQEDAMALEHVASEEGMRTVADRLRAASEGQRRTPPKPKTLASGSSGEPKTGEKGRAAAALRSLRQG